MRPMKNSFNAQAFADYFGISKDTLLYYDRIGLFGPDHIADNGYRVYTPSQIEPFWALLVLRNSGVPIKDLREYFDHPSPEHLKTIVNERIDAVDAEVRRLQQTRLHLKELHMVICEINKADHIGDQVVFETVLLEPIVLGAKNKTPGPTNPETWNQLYDDLASKTNLDQAARIGSIISKVDLAKGEFSHVDRVFAISPERHRKKGETQLVAVRYWKGPYESISTCYPEIVAYLETEGFMIAGDAREEYLSTSITTTNESEYLTRITIPIKKRS